MIINGVTITKQDRYVEKFIKANHNLANDDDALCVGILESEGLWTISNHLVALRSCTSVDSIKRSRRRLHQAGLITYSEKVSKKRGQLFEQERDRNSTANIHAIKNSLEKGHIFSKTEEELFEGFPKVEIKGDTAYIVEKPKLTMDDLIPGAKEEVQTSMLGDS
jgi:hypothetical protein